MNNFKKQINKYKTLLKLLLDFDCMKEVQTSAKNNEDEYVTSVETPLIDYYMEQFELDSNIENEYNDIKEYVESLDLDKETILKLNKEFLSITPYIDDLSNKSIKQFIGLGKCYLLEYKFIVIYDIDGETVYMFSYKNGIHSPLGDYSFGTECRIPYKLYFKLTNLFLRNNVSFEHEVEDIYYIENNKSLINEVDDKLTAIAESGAVDISNIHFDNDALEQMDSETLEKLQSLDSLLDNMSELFHSMFDKKDKDEDIE